MIVSEAQGEQRSTFILIILKTVDYTSFFWLHKCSCIVGENFLYFESLMTNVCSRQQKQLMGILSFWQIQYIVVSYWTWASAAAFSEQHKDDDDEGEFGTDGKAMADQLLLLPLIENKKATVEKWFKYRVCNLMKLCFENISRIIQKHQRESLLMGTCLATFWDRDRLTTCKHAWLILQHY